MHDAPEQPCWLDSEEYNAYVEDVYNAFVAMGGTATFSQVKSYMCLLFDERRFFDAISTLQAAGRIRQTREVYPLTWAISAPPREQKKGWNKAFGVVRRKEPYPESVSRERRVTA